MRRPQTSLSLAAMLTFECVTVWAGCAADAKFDQLGCFDDLTVTPPAVVIAPLVSAEGGVAAAPSDSAASETTMSVVGLRLQQQPAEAAHVRICVDQCSDQGRPSDGAADGSTCGPSCATKAPSRNGPPAIELLADLPDGSRAGCSQVSSAELGCVLSAAGAARFRVRALGNIAYHRLVAQSGFRSACATVYVAPGVSTDESPSIKVYLPPDDWQKVVPAGPYLSCSGLSSCTTYVRRRPFQVATLVDNSPRPIGFPLPVTLSLSSSALWLSSDTNCVGHSPVMSVEVNATTGFSEAAYVCADARGLQAAPPYAIHASAIIPRQGQAPTFVQTDEPLSGQPVSAGFRVRGTSEALDGGAAWTNTEVDVLDCEGNPIPGATADVAYGMPITHCTETTGTAGGCETVDCPSANQCCPSVTIDDQSCCPVAVEAP
jgi:hypothetical protein